MSETKEVVKSEKIQVTMQDGSVVGFNQKQKIVTEVKLSEEGFGIVFNCRGGQKYSLELENDHKLFVTLAAHGAKQKVGDSAVKCENDDDLALAIERTVNQLIAGQWVERSGDGIARGLADLIEAVRRAKNYEAGSDAAKASAESIKGMSDDTIKTLRSNATVKGHLLAIAQERAAAAQAKALASQSESDLDALEALGL